VGVQVRFDAETAHNVFWVARKLILDGTAALLEELLGSPNPGEYIGVVTELGRPGCLTYVVGVVVDGGRELPEGLPDGAVSVICPEGRYALVRTKGDQMQAYDFLVKGFREDTPYVCDPGLPPLHLYGADGELVVVGEPVRVPRDEDERLAAIHWEVVSLPQIRFAGIKRPMSAGDDVIGLFFAIQSRVRGLPCAELFQQDYLGIPYYEAGQSYSCFGARVSSFEGIPEGIDTITKPGGLFLHLMDHGLNGDNPTRLTDARGAVLARVSDAYEHDPSRDDLYRFRLGMAASLFVAVKPKAG
jgi:hypothetical protein